MLLPYVYHMKQRQPIFDNAKALLMFLVVFGHFAQPSEHGIHKDIVQFLYIFHMPAFAFVSGYWSKKGTSVKGSVYRYLAPYLFFQGLYVLINYLLKIEHPSNSLTGFISVPTRTLWYLVSLFSWTVMLNFVSEKHIKTVVALSFLLPFCSALIPGLQFSISRTLYFFPFFLLGYSARISEFSLGSDKLAWKAFAVLFFVGLFFLCRVAPIDIRILFAYSSFRSLGIDVASGMIIRCVVIVLSLAGCFAFFVLVPTAKTAISEYGSRTMQIFLIHDIAVRIAVRINLYQVPAVLLHVAIIALTVGTYYITSLPAFGEFIQGISKTSKNIVLYFKKLRPV